MISIVNVVLPHQNIWSRAAAVGPNIAYYRRSILENSCVKSICWKHIRSQGIINILMRLDNNRVVVWGTMWLNIQNVSPAIFFDIYNFDIFYQINMKMVLFRSVSDPSLANLKAWSFSPIFSQALVELSESYVSSQNGYQCNQSDQIMIRYLQLNAVILLHYLTSKKLIYSKRECKNVIMWHVFQAATQFCKIKF